MKKMYCFFTACLLVLTSFSFAQTSPDSCSIKFETTNTASSLLIKTFYAVPKHNHNKKPERICWSFGDGTDTCITYNPALANNYAVHHTYKKEGDYKVCVKAIFQGGCEASFCQQIHSGISGDCKVGIEVATSGFNKYKKEFTAITVSSKKVAKVCWNFGDGKDTCIEYPDSYTGPYHVAHIYNGNKSQYEACVKIIYYGGCEAKACKLITLLQEECIADFEKIDINSTNQLTTFRAQPWHNKEKKPARICWIFGDGKDTCITYPENYNGTYTVNHHYREPGNYEVCVKIFYQGGCEAKKCNQISIRKEECKADFEKIDINSTNQLTNFRAQPGHNQEKKPAKICWNFGDGKDTCITYPANYTGTYTVNHHYREPGKYEVCLKILYHGGCEAKKCKEIKIDKPVESCKVGILESSVSNSNLTRGFYVAAYPADRKIERICWNFGDGNDTCIMASTSTQLNLIHHTYPGPGAYKTCVKVLFAGGCTAYWCKEVEIKRDGSVCGGYLKEELTSRLTYNFHGQGINNGNPNDNRYYWTFGDGSNSTGQNTSHTYSQPGQYEVCLTIKNNEGCETRICKKLSVGGDRQPVLELSPNPVIDILHIKFWSTRNETVTIQIMSAGGMVLRSMQKVVIAGANTWDVNLAGLQTGVYSVLIQSANQQASAIFFKH